MEKTKLQEMYNTSWDYHGAGYQFDILIEEMSELTKAIIKARRKDQEFTPDIVEELADVTICVGQIVNELERTGNDNEYYQIINTKLERLEDRLKVCMQKRIKV